MQVEYEENENILYSSDSETGSKYDIIVDEVYFDIKTANPSAFCYICGSALTTILKCRCDVSYCSPCLKLYFEQKIAEFDCDKVKCPSQICSISNLAKSSLSEDQYEKFKKFGKTLKHLRNPEIIFCPKPDCQGVSLRSNKKLYSCNICKYQFVNTFDPNKAEILQNLSIVECPSCFVMIERTFGCQEMKCPCGFEFCMKCGQEISDVHSNWKCALAGRSGRVSLLFICLLFYFPVVFPFSPFFIIIGYHLNWDRNYFKMIDKHPSLYPLCLFFLSPVIFILSFFVLPFIYAGLCIEVLFGFRSCYTEGVWLFIIKAFLYLPSVLLFFLGWLIFVALVICLSPLYGSVLLVKKLMNPKNEN